MKAALPILLAAVAGLAACASGQQTRGILYEGMERGEVQQAFGQPCREAKRSVSGQPRTELGFYCIRGNPDLTVFLEDDKVVDWRENR